MTDEVALIEAYQLTKRFTTRPSVLARLLARRTPVTIHAVDGIDLMIKAGHTLGIVGESGSGKTTLGRLLVGLEQPTSGEIRFAGEPLDGMSPARLRQLRYERQIVFQNPYASLNPRKTVRQILEVPLWHRGVRDYFDQEAEAVRLLSQVGLSERFLDLFPHQLSGGQRQRVAIARSLAMHPRFLVLDEPVSSLDVSIQAQLLNLLKEIQVERQLTYLFIAHNLAVVHYMSDDIAVMYLGKIVEQAPADELFRSPLHPYTRALLSAIPQLDRSTQRKRILLSGDPPDPTRIPIGCPFHTRCPFKLGRICEVERPQWIQDDRHGVACHLYSNG